MVGADVVGVGVVGRQGWLNKLRTPNDDGFVFINHWGGWWRIRKNARCWWREQCNLTKKECAKGLDGFHFVKRYIVDASNGGCESCCGINNSVGSSYFRDWDGMMLESEHVGDPLATCVSHEDSNATIVIRDMQ